MKVVIEQCKLACTSNPYTRCSTQCTTRVRRAFYNEALFDYTPEVMQAAWQRNNYRFRVGRVWNFGLNFLITVAVLTIVLYFVPGVLDRVIPGRGAVGAEETAREEVTNNSNYILEELVIPATRLEAENDGMTSEHRVQPEYDLSLPEGKWVVAPEIGLAAPIYSNNDINNKAEVDGILDRGIYLYPEYNNIGWAGKRVILAGHHYNMAIGEQKEQQSFQNLASLQVGDRVQVIDDYKIWTYEVYKVEESTEITESEPDLMMYTCVNWWDAKTRTFVYANIVE